MAIVGNYPNPTSRSVLKGFGVAKRYSKKLNYSYKKFMEFPTPKLRRLTDFCPTSPRVFL
jgi:hypothetical protein